MRRGLTKREQRLVKREERIVSCQQVLRRQASIGRTITYKDLAKKLGAFYRSLRTILNEVGHREQNQTRHDLSIIVVQTRTGYPSRFDGKPFDRRNTVI